MRKTSQKFLQSNLLCRVALVAILLAFQAMLGIGAGVLYAQKVTGTVISGSDNEPLIGASVMVQGTKVGSVTDLDGNFTIDAKNGQTLEVSYLGFITQKVKVNGQKLNITLQEDKQSLDEVVVVGYGVQKKKLVTGATVQLKGDDIAKLNTTNPLSAMQGQTPGVNIVSTSGQPGAAMSVTIRGLGTVGNSQPLYLIDGVGGDITTLNPADIESIDVLKDAASAAIYGAQAANGVVLVTTKSGKEGSSKITYDGYVGWQTLGRKFEMLNSNQYMQIMDEALLNSYNMSPIDWTSLSAIRDANGNVYNTDWIDQAVDNGALTTSHSLAFTGGSKTSTYSISGGYTGQDGLIGGSDVSYYKRYNLRVNSEHKMWNGLVTIGEHVGFVYKDSRGMGTGNIYNNNLRSAFSTSPLVPVYDADGNYYSTVDSDWNKNDGNPYGTMMMNRYNQSKSTSVDANVYVQIEPIKNLKFKTVFGLNYGGSNYRSFTPIYKFTPQSGNGITKVNQSNGNGTSLVWTNTLTYDFNIKEHHISALLGSETTKYDGESTGSYGVNLTAGFDDWEHAYVENTEKGHADRKVSGGPYDATRGQSFFARLGWSWKDRYMVNATMRADGSSKFAKGHRWGYFPSVSAGWTLTEEDFMKSAASWLDFLKLRLSWGQVGNANINCYQYLAPVTTYNTNYNFGATGGTDAWVMGAYTERLANEKVKWETSEQYNVGLDARFLRQRLSLTLDGYIKSTKDWLVQAPILATAGTGGPVINGGDVKNKGIEVGLSWNDQIGKDLVYSVGANFAYNHNEVGNIPTLDGIIHGATNQIYQNAEEFYRAENGHAIGYFWGYKTAGIFQNQKEIDEWVAAGNGVLQGSSVKPGDVKYYDVNHDGTINDADKVNLGNGMPDFTYGFSLGFDYKGLDFSVTANGSVGNDIVQSYRNVGAKTANYTSAILQRWTGEGTSNKYPRVTETNVNYQFSDLFIQDGDFLRISNITLGYDFAKLLHQKFVSQARLYFQVQNAFTFTKYDGMDPEIGYGVNSWASGVDLGYYPRPRTFMVGLNLKF